MTQGEREEINIVDMLDSGSYRIEYDFVQSLGSKTWVASCPISRDVQGQYVVTVDSVLHHSSSWTPEFEFRISKNFLYGDLSSVHLYSSSAARPYVPEWRRGEVVEVVIESLRGLIGRAWPDEVMREIKEPHKPNKRVHERITNTFTQYGYTTEYRWPDKMEYRWVHVAQS